MSKQTKIYILKYFETFQTSRKKKLVLSPDFQSSSGVYVTGNVGDKPAGVFFLRTKSLDPASYRV